MTGFYMMATLAFNELIYGVPAQFPLCQLSPEGGHRSLENCTLPWENK